MPSPASTQEIARREATFKTVTTLSGNTTLKVTDSGGEFLVSQAAADDITLPKMAACGAGWNATFTVKTTGSNDVDIIAGDTDTISGLEVADAATTITELSKKVTFAGSAAGVGDWCHIWTDGTLWYARQFSFADAGATHTA